LIEHIARVTLPNTVGNDVLKNSSDHRVVVAIVSRENDGDIRRLRPVGLAGSLVHLSIMVLRRKGERMIDPIGVAGSWHRRVTGALKDTASPSPMLVRWLRAVVSECDSSALFSFLQSCAWGAP
jgi:hypothetical protein